MTREGTCALCTKVRVPGKRGGSLARLDCIRGANEPELGFSLIAFAQASAPRKQRRRHRSSATGETARGSLAFRCSAARTDTCTELCFRWARRLEPCADRVPKPL